MNAAYKVFLLGTAALLAAGCAELPPRSSHTITGRVAAAERLILVTVVEPRSSSLAITGAPAPRYLRRSGYAASSVVERTLRALAREYAINRLDGWPISSLGVYCEVYEVAAGHSVEQVVATLHEDSRVDLVQRMHTFETLTAPAYDDPLASLQWSVPQLAVPEAHQMATGQGVLIAVVDSGVDTRHPDLEGRIREERNLVRGDEPPDGEIHGTAVAGIIASVANNHEGIVGIAPDVTIAALRACWAVDADAASAQCSSFTLARAIETALELRPRVINLSLGGPFDPLLSRLIDEAIRRGIVVVAAADGSDASTSFPASHPHVIVARAANGAPTGLSPYMLAAPGTEILTTTPHAGYAFLSGNSLAAAHVSGVVALLLQVKSTLTADEVATLLAGSTTYSTGTVSINACLALDRLVDAHGCPRQAEIASF